MSGGGDESVCTHLFLAVAREGLTLRDLAERTGISTEGLGELFWNCAQPEPSELRALAQTLSAGADSPAPALPLATPASANRENEESTSGEPATSSEGPAQGAELWRLMEIVDARAHEADAARRSGV